jgi:hypothetical protein
MSGYKTNAPAINTDFGAIEAAVMETDRGRAFLQEFARRNRHADTEVLLTSLSRIEKSIEIRQEPSGVDQFRGDLLEMANAIAKTRKEIAAVHTGEATSGSLFEASGELDSIVNETESATSDILASAERIQEAAFTMREEGADPLLCELLDQQATAIYTACSFQDLTAQRTRKVIDALGFIETRINAMVDIWAFAPKLEEKDSDLNYHPTGTGRAKIMSQADVDFVLVEEDQPSRNTAFIDAEALSVETPVPDFDEPGSVEPGLDETDEILFSRDAALAAVAVPEPSGLRENLRVVSNPQDVSSTLQRAKSGIALSADEAEKALDALKAMSVEDRTLLFS